MYSGGQSTGMFCAHRSQDTRLRQASGLPQDPERSTESRAAEGEEDEAGTQQAERYQKAADPATQPGVHSGLA